MSGPSRYVVHIGDAPVEVLLDGKGGAQIGDQRYTVVQSGDGRTLVRPLGGHTQLAVTLAGSPRPSEAHVNGRRVPFEIQSAAEAALDEALGGGRSAGGDGQVRAPMPGRIVKILVKPGDTLEVDTPVVIVEAMKMENELGAPRAGVVSELHVSEGDAVEAGALLVGVDATSDA